METILGKFLDPNSTDVKQVILQRICLENGVPGIKCMVPSNVKHSTFSRYSQIFAYREYHANKYYQERRRARERGETHFRYISIGGDILLSGVEDESGDPVTALPMAKISNTSPHNKSSAGKEASALANLPYGKNILRAVGSSPDDMGANAMEPYAPTYSRMERMAIVDLINPRLSLEKESSVGIPDEPLTQSTFPDITTTHRKKTVIPGVEVKLESIRNSLINQINGLNFQMASSQFP